MPKKKDTEKKEVKKVAKKKATTSKVQKNKANKKTGEKKTNHKVELPILEPSKIVDFNEFEKVSNKKEKIIDRKKEEALFDAEIKKQEKKQTPNQYGSSLSVIILILLILIGFNMVTMWQGNLKKSWDDDKKLSEAENKKDKKKEEEINYQTMTCQTAEVPIENYYQTAMSISSFEDDKLVSYELIVTKRYLNENDYYNAKVQHQSATDIIFDNNQYFGNGHLARTPQENNYVGLSTKEVKEQETQAGSVCTIE